MSESINKYKDLMSYLNNIKMTTEDENLKVFCDKLLVDFINDFYKNDMNNKVFYKNLIEKYNINKDKLMNIEEQENKITPTNNINKFELYERELENIFNNPNEESIKVWLKNIISYGKNNNIKNEIINAFIYDSFKKIDINNKYTKNLEEYINEINEKKENENNINNDYKKAQEYVLNNIYKNKDVNIGNRFQKIVNQLKEDIKNDNRSYIIESVNDYLDFIEDYENILDVDMLDEYLNYIFKKTGDKHIDVVEKIKEDAAQMEQKNISYKIKNIKKSFKSNDEILNLSLSALVGLGTSIINPIYGILLGIGTYYTFKKRDKYIMKFIEKNGLKINENNELTDSSGKIITKDNISKLKYNLVRQALNKIDNGKIDKNYKKNRLTHILLNNSAVNNIRKKFKIIKSNDYETPQLVKDINKGMRQV